MTLTKLKHFETGSERKNMMTPQDKEKLLLWNEKIKNEIHITLVLSDGYQANNAMDKFCSTLSSFLPKIVVERKKVAEESSPAIEIGERLRYRAVPLGPELEPFLEAVTFQESLLKELPKTVQDKLIKIRVPAMLKLYIAPQCPFCPAAVRKFVALSFANEYVNLQVIDGIMFPDAAESDNIQSAPTVTFDDFRWSGTIRLQEVVDVISNRDPAGLSAITLNDMIRNGGASQVAQLMIEHHSIFPGFIDLLIDEKWPVRLGAMVAVEEIIERDPGLASQVIEPVLRRFPSLDDQAKGDMIYLMGETGTLDTISRLKSAFDGLSSDELKTFAVEAIESIEARHKKLHKKGASQIDGERV